VESGQILDGPLHHLEQLEDHKPHFEKQIFNYRQNNQDLKPKRSKLLVRWNSQPTPAAYPCFTDQRA